MKSLMFWGTLGFVFVLAAIVSQLQITNVLHDVDALILLFLLFMAVKRLFIRKNALNTASGAIIMASGIFISGAFHYFPELNDAIGRPAALALFLLWLWFMVVYIRGIFYKKHRKLHIEDPIQSFAIGTWIAGTSVCGTVLFHRLPELRWIAEGMAIIDAGLWLFFFVLCLKNFAKVFSKHLYGRVHGIILLSTVSTQSIVIFYSSLFQAVVPHAFVEVFLLIGVIFYGIGFGLILKRYFPFRRVGLEKNWTNTNCILHGAMSITGLAGIISQTIPLELVKVIWVWALVWFVIVEGCEIYRAILRVKIFGLVRGIGTYDVSQWARNFTFGMFFAFTMNVNLPAGSFLSGVQAVILPYGAWIVLLLFVNELLLSFKGNGQRQKKHVQIR
ncbi:MAG TPA: hypothetical protein VFK33_04325 [Bacillales bacterium]|nr:hypothetical protein [Bacillales bacterium]